MDSVYAAGIAMLLFAMFMSGRLGIFQETLYATYGKHPREAMFYSVRSPVWLTIMQILKFLACFASARIFATCPRPVE